MISKYQNVVVGGRRILAHGKVSKIGLTSTSKTACEAKGRGWHLMLARLEFTAITWQNGCHKVNMPRGNTSYGKKPTTHNANRRDGRRQPHADWQRPGQLEPRQHAL